MFHPRSPLALDAAPHEARLTRLTAGQEAEALRFLAARPLHTVFMSGLIIDNGLDSAANRGDFYAFRAANGALEGVALIGHATLWEARTHAATRAFAQQAKGCQHLCVVRAEPAEMDRFWKCYAVGGRAPRRLGRELLLARETCCAPPGPQLEPERATLDDLEQIAEINARMALEESGTDPRQRDPEGFRRRLAHRIGQGRVWVWKRDGKLIFKADVVAKSDSVAYLEGVHVAPEERGRGYGLQCINGLSARLAAQVPTICLTVNEQLRNVVGFYVKAGYALRASYETLYL